MRPYYMQICFNMPLPDLNSFTFRRRDALVFLKVLNVSTVVDPDGLIAHKCAMEMVLPIACLV